MEALKQAYETVADPENPRAQVVAVVGEAGFGKTRLVQWFFHWLSTAKDGVGDAGYWPDELKRDGVNLTLNPSHCNPKNEQQYIWAATRLPDPLDRNSVAPSGLLGGLLEHFFIHATEFYRRRENQKVQDKMHLLMRETILDLSLESAATWLPGASLALSLARKGWENHKLRHESRQLDSFGSGEAHRRKVDDLSTRFLDALRDMYDPDKRFGRGVPIVLFIDDAHWLQHDPGLTGFLMHLIPEAERRNWPILLVLTSRVIEWQEGFPIQELITRRYPDDWEPLVLQKHPNLWPVLEAAFPDELTGTDAQIILNKADGNPLLLDQIISLLKETPRYHISRDCSKPLNPAALASLRDTTFEVHTLIKDRLKQADQRGTAIRNTLALSSIQGNTFITSWTQDILTLLDKRWSAQEAVDEAINPYALLIRDDEQLTTFAQNAVFEIARETLEHDFPADLSVVYDALASVLETYLTNTNDTESNADRIHLLQVAASLHEAGDEKSRNIAAVGLARLAAMLYFQGDIYGASMAAHQFEKGWRAGRWSIASIDIETLLTVLDALSEFHTPADCRGLALEILLTARKLDARDHADTSLILLASVLSRIARAEEAGWLFQEAQTMLLEAQSILKRLPSELVLDEQACILVQLASLEQAQGKEAQANKLAYEAVVIYRANKGEHSWTYKSLATFAETLHWVSTCALERGELTEAEAASRDELAILRQLSEMEVTGPAIRVELSQALMRLSEVMVRSGAFAEAAALVADAISLARSEVARIGTPYAKMSLAFVLITAVAVELKKDEQFDANVLLNEAIKIASEVADGRGSPNDWNRLAAIWSFISKVANERGSAEAFERAVREELAIWVRLNDETDSLVAQQQEAIMKYNLSIALVAIAEVAMDTGDYERSEKLFYEAESIARDVVETRGYARDRRQLANVLGYRAFLSINMRDTQEAETRHREALAIAHELKEESDTVEAREYEIIAIDNLSCTLGHGADRALLEGNLAHAECLFSEAIELAGSVVKSRGNAGDRENYALLLGKLAELCLTNDDVAAAEPRYWEALAVWEKLCSESPTVSIRASTSITLLSLAGIAYNVADFDKAEKLFRLAHAMDRDLSKEAATDETVQRLEYELHSLGFLATIRGDTSEAESLGRECLAIIRHAITNCERCAAGLDE